MPMIFADFESLKRCAEVHKFRPPNAGESEQKFRTALADHIKPIDFVESLEVRFKSWPERYPDVDYSDVPTQTGILT